MIRKNDISTPEGYFEDLQMRLSEIPRRESAPSGIRRLAPYLAYAASLVVAVMLGNFILRQTARPAEDDTWTYVSYLADALDPDGAALVDMAAWEEETYLSEALRLQSLGYAVANINYRYLGKGVMPSDELDDITAAMAAAKTLCAQKGVMPPSKKRTASATPGSKDMP